MIEQSNVFNKAAECEHLINSETDIVRAAVLESLRDMWIKLANESDSMTPTELAQHFDDIERIQAGFQEATKKQ